MNKIVVVILSVLLAFCANAQITNVPPGVIIRHIPKADGLYVGSPSLCRLDNGDYIASHDVFGPNANTGNSGTTFIYKSSDKGITWQQISKIGGQYWSALFLYDNKLYVLGLDKGHGNIVIRRSSDNGFTWTVPSNSQTGLLFQGHYHTAPTIPAFHNGRIWKGFEDADAIVSNLPIRYGAVMVSADLSGDLLNSDNWKMTNRLVYNKEYMDGKFLGWLEGQALVTHDNRLVNIIRVHIHPGTKERAAIIKTTCENDKIYFQPNAGFIDFPGGSKKFTIRYDEKTQRYWSLVNNIPAGYDSAYPAAVRNYLSLVSSKDLYHWEINKTILSHPDRFKHGFQYVDWLFESDDIVFLSRTAYDDDFGGADNYHNSNYLTFHRISNYKGFLK